VYRSTVVDALQELVDAHLAEWRQAEQGELELHLTTGEIFILSDAGISITTQPRPDQPRISTG